MNWVVDASVVVKWILNNPVTEPHADAALDLLDHIVGRDTVCQPPHWLIEVISVTNRKMPGRAGECLAALSNFDWDIVDDFEILKHAAELSEAMQHHYFDTLYHAVALATDGLLVTADQRYLQKSRGLGHIVELPDWRQAID